MIRELSIKEKDGKTTGPSKLVPDKVKSSGDVETCKETNVTKQIKFERIIPIKSNLVLISSALMEKEMLREYTTGGLKLT